MPLIRKRSLMAFKLEAVEGVAETPANADATLVTFDTSFNPSPEFNDRAPFRRTLTPILSIRGKAMAEMTFSFELRGEDTTADSIPSWGLILKAAGWAQTPNAGVSVVYRPENDPEVSPSLTIAGYIDGILRKMRGARISSLEIKAPVDGIVMVTCTARGVLIVSGDTDATILTPTYATALPFAFGAGAAGTSVATLGGFQFKGVEININQGITGTDRMDPSLEHGVRSYALTGRKFTGSLDSELELVATKAWLSEVLANTSNALVLKYGVGVTGREINIEAPFMQWTGLSDANRDDLATVELPFQLVGAVDAIDDEIVITKK